MSGGAKDGVSRELRCPECGSVFQIDESSYAEIAAQVRTAELRADVEREVALAREAMAAKHRAELEMAVAKARSAGSDRERDLMARLSDERARAERLDGELRSARERQDLAVERAVRDALLDASAREQDLRVQLEYYKDLKTRMSTKMVGETLEQHCMTEFNRIRALAFPNAYFEKDNEVSRSGSKGDFIFREECDGVPLLSIMFEMKNEMDTTATKHRNEDFLKELDKDRREKGCEYAVLVSMLEADSEYYNDGIVDMSHRYPKMYVIRPQFFIPLISVLRNAALNVLDARRELRRMQAMDVDVTRFEEALGQFKENIGKNYDLASRQFQSAIDEIDKSIDHMQKVKSALLSSERNLRLMAGKADDLTIRRLAKDSPSLRDMFGQSGL